MPNHITNYVEIKGSKEQIAGLIDRALGEQGGEPYFDFGGIIPMPEELRRTSSPTQIVATQEEADAINSRHLESVLGRGGTTTPAITQSEADRRRELYGDQLFAFHTEHSGVLNWYDFAVKYWGTKWGAYELVVLAQEPERLVLSFQTAWAPPEPIFDKLVAEGLEVNCMWQDEDPSNYGEYGNPWRVFYRESTIEFAG